MGSWAGGDAAQAGAGAGARCRGGVSGGASGSGATGAPERNSPSRPALPAARLPGGGEEKPAPKSHGISVTGLLCPSCPSLFKYVSAGFGQKEKLLGWFSISKVESRQEGLLPLPAAPPHIVILGAAGPCIVRSIIAVNLWNMADMCCSIGEVPEPVEPEPDGSTARCTVPNLFGVIRM